MIIKTLDINDGELFVTSGGQRRELAEFNGWIDISEDTVYVPILGVPHKGQKRIRAAVILCGDVNYKMEVKPDTIHSGNV